MVDQKKGRTNRSRDRCKSSLLNYLAGVWASPQEFQSGGPGKQMLLIFDGNSERARPMIAFVRNR